MTWNIIIRVHESALDADGIWLLTLVRHQSRQREHLLTVRHGACYVELNHHPSADGLAVVLLDTRTPAERVTQRVSVFTAPLGMPATIPLPDYVPAQPYSGCGNDSCVFGPCVDVCLLRARSRHT